MISDRLTKVVILMSLARSSNIENLSFGGLTVLVALQFKQLFLHLSYKINNTNALNCILCKVFFLVLSMCLSQAMLDFHPCVI